MIIPRTGTEFNRKAVYCRTDVFEKSLKIEAVCAIIYTGDASKRGMSGAAMGFRVHPVKRIEREGEAEMMKRMVRWGAGILIALLTLASAWAGVAETAEPDAATAVKPHNYILIIDNSRSTTGRHSLGDATDSRGLRFDAAKLVYQNVISAAATGGRGKLGVIVFCGPKNCVSYGPMDIDDEALDDEIGKYLNAEANAHRRDNYTDIRTALKTAQEMMADFEGDTSVILLTDGVNDLTNRADPFSQPENIAANADCAELVAQMHAEGVDFQMIALTAQENVTNADAFMVFINSLAEAAGGEPGEDGEYNNVLMATQADLDSKLVQTLIKAESASESIQTIVESTPVEAPFNVPYDGIADATVNITFMPEDKVLLEDVTLAAPDGSRYTLWDTGGIHEQAGISVTESRSYIMLRIPDPQSKDWSVIVNSRKAANDTDTHVLINAVVRFNHNLRVNVEMDDAVLLGDPVHVEAWLQSFNGKAFEDVTDSGIYDQSKATLTVFTPNGNKKTVAMKRDGNRYITNFKPKTAGSWKAEVKIQNPYVQQTQDDIDFLVIAPTPEPTPETTPEPAIDSMPQPVTEIMPTPEPTAEGFWDTTPEPTATPRPRQTPVPTPTPSPEPEVIPITSLALSIEPSVTTEDGETFLSGDQATFSWTLQEETDSIEAVLMQGKKSIGKLVSGMSFDSSFFKDGVEYAFTVTAMPKNGEIMGAEPVVETLSFRAAPSPLSEDAITLNVEPQVPDADDAIYVDRNAEQITLSWDVTRETDAVTAELLEDGAPMAKNLKSGDTVDRNLLKDGSEYVLRVTALPKNGALTGTEPTEKTLAFRLYPLPTAVNGLTMDVSGGNVKNGVSKIKGNTAKLTWSAGSDNIDHYELTVTDAKGNLVARETLSGSATSYNLNKGKGDYRVELVAVPRYGSSEDETVARASLTVHSLSFLERFWYIIAGVAVLLAGAAVALVMLLKDRNAKHVTGTLRVRCDALDMNQVLTFFDDRKGVKVDDPITTHAELAKLKGKKAYALLSNVRLNNAMTDRDGRAPGEPEPQGDGENRHRGNAKVLRLTWTDPQTKQDTVCYVGRYDVEPTTLVITDGGQEYEFIFTGA